MKTNHNNPTIYNLPKPSTSQTKSKKYIFDCDEKLKTSNYTTKDWFEIQTLIQSTNNDEKNKIILGILDKHKKCVVKIGESETLQKEYIISKSLFSSNTIDIFCFFTCNENSNYLCNPKEQSTMSVLLMEYIEEGNMRDFNFYNTPLAFYSCMKQVLLSMIELCYNQGFYHNDLHAGNVLVKSTKEKTIQYTIDNKIYTIETNGYKVVIMDFEKSVLIHKPKTTYYNKDFLQNDIYRFIIDIMTNSKTITFDKEQLIQITNTLDIDTILSSIDAIHLKQYTSLETLMKERMIDYMIV